MIFLMAAAQKTQNFYYLLVAQTHMDMVVKVITAKEAAAKAATLITMTRQFPAADRVTRCFDMNLTKKPWCITL